MGRSLRKFTRFAVAFASGLIGVLLLFGYLGPWLPLADSVAHFRLHLVVAAAIAMVALAVAHAWATARFLGAASVAGVVGLISAFPEFGATATWNRTPPVTLVQLNLYFENPTPDAVAQLLRTRRPDIIALQEVTQRNFPAVAAVARDYPSRIFCRFAGIGAVAVLSRLPEAPSSSQAPSKGCVEREGLAWLRVMVNGRPVSVASMHLHWPYPYGQAEQIDRLEKHLKVIPRPVMVAGDMNAAGWSHTVDRIEQATDTTVAAGLRFTLHKRPFSWAPSWLSVGLPIDHLLLPEGLEARTITLDDPVGSDHLPIVAKLGWR